MSIGERKKRRLYQNRASALKCRKKKKEQFNKLLHERDLLKMENARLQEQVQQFSQMVTQLQYEKEQFQYMNNMYSQFPDYSPAPVESVTAPQMQNSFIKIKETYAHVCL